MIFKVEIEGLHIQGGPYTQGGIQGGPYFREQLLKLPLCPCFSSQKVHKPIKLFAGVLWMI